MKEFLKTIVYRAAEIASRGRGVARSIGGDTIRFPPRYSRYYPAGYEPDLFQFLKNHCKDGDVFFDCGAHFGLFSVVASRLVGPNGRVFSFEPTRAVRAVLGKVVKINNCDNIVIRSEALSREAGTATFFETDAKASNANSLAKQARHDHGMTVHTISIDEVAAEHNVEVNCMKVDVEGAEFDLLVGAESTMMKHRPLVFLSLHPRALTEMGASLSGVWDILDSYQFDLKHIGESIDKDWFVKQTELFDVECLPR